MFTRRSCQDLLNLEDNNNSKLSRIMSAPDVFSNSNDNKNNKVDETISPGRRVMVSNELPLHAYRDVKTNKWCFEYDNDSLVLQLKYGFDSDVEVLYVGCLKDVHIDVAEQDEVAQFLLDNFQCVPTFLHADIQKIFYHGFCKDYLWPLFHYMLPVLSSHGARFERSQWQAYVSANKVFADKIIEVINPDEDYVWIHDYHLMVLPTFLRKRFYRVKLGFFLHSSFPTSEIFRTLPVRDEILRTLLNCDLIGFHTFDYARHFLSCCSRLLGIDYESKRGYIGLEYYGRTVSIKILPLGIHTGQIETVMSLNSTGKKVEELRKKYEGKIVMLGVDDMDLFKGISFKFMAMRQLLEQHHDLRGKVVLVQITNPARSSGKDVQDVQNETDLIANEVNQKYGDEGYKPIVFLKGSVSTQEKVAYYALSECVVVNAVRDGMNLVPYKYTFCRQGNPVLDKALGIDEKSSPRTSVVVMSEFMGCSPSLSGAIRVNPWNIEAVSEAMNTAIKMSNEEKHLRHEKLYKYVSSHDVAYWTSSLNRDLERACREHHEWRCWGIGLGLGFKVVALGPNFRKLSVDHVVSSYNKTKSRLILLDYDGTMMPEASVGKPPSAKVISLLNRLCENPKNVVFIVSGREKESLAKWFSPCKKLGISAEHGYFTRWTRDSPWKTCGLPMDLNWKKVVEPVMELYAESTDGSYIEHKESALVWHHQEADSQLCSYQAKELVDHLENVLANEPVAVKRGQHIVEVKAQGISKGIAVEELISALRVKGNSPDFVLCIGDDRSDEDMFESIAKSVVDPSLPAIAEVFACTVGQKPSLAKYYLDDTAQVLNLLQGLAKGS